MNRECAVGAASIYPLSGDVTSTAGSATVFVSGLLGVPISNNPLTPGAILQYDQVTNNWTPIVIGSVQVNSISISDDNIVTVNLMRPIKINGV
jgi:hypothetical protein